MCKLGVLYLEYCSNHMQAGMHLTASTYMSINRTCLTLNEYGILLQWYSSYLSSGDMYFNSHSQAPPTKKGESLDIGGYGI